MCQANTWKDSDIGKDWGQEKGTTEDGITNSMAMSLSWLREIVKDKEAWHAACSQQGGKEFDMTEWLNDKESTGKGILWWSSG